MAAAILAGGLAAAWLPARAANLTVPLRDATGATATLYSVDLDNGRVFEVEPRRAGEAVRLRPLAQNLFSAIGRPLDLAAAPGEFVIEGLQDRSGRTRALLLVETSSGYVAFLTRLGEDQALGVVRTVAGRPGEPLVGTDGQYALLMRREASRRAEQAYLIHASNGGCLIFSGVERFEEDPSVRRCEALPAFQLASNAVPLETESGTVTGYVLVDGKDGSVLFIYFSAERDDRLIVARSTTQLGSLFPAVEGTPLARRFALASLRDGDGATAGVLVVDSASLRMALLTGIERPSTAKVTLLPPDLAPLLARTARHRPLEAVARASANGATSGVWVLGDERSQILWVSDPLNRESLRVQSVEQRQ